MRVGRVLLGVVAVGAACGSASNTPAYADHTCELHAAIVAIRADDDPTLTEVVETYETVSAFVASC